MNREGLEEGRRRSSDKGSGDDRSGNVGSGTRDESSCLGSAGVHHKDLCPRGHSRPLEDQL
eukprot:SM000012S25364  [mRNA]  locus=s12:655516:656121:- [translate_table: standard]